MKFPYTMHASKRDMVKRTKSILEQLYAWGFRLMVLLSGHYPPPWIKFLRKAATEFHKNHPDAFTFGGSEYLFATGVGYIGDHAAKWETAIAMALFPEFVDITKAPEGISYVERAAQHAIWGFDPRIHANPALGAQVVEAIVTRLSDAVNEAWRTKSQKPFEEIYRESRAAMKKVHTLKGAMKYTGMENKADIAGILKWMILERKKARRRETR